jgi:transposase
VIANRGYGFPGCRDLLRRRGFRHTIPERKDQRERRTARPGRRPSFDREAHRGRDVVESCVGLLKQWRGVATRYEKRAANDRTMVALASLMVWMPS